MDKQSESEGTDLREERLAWWRCLPAWPFLWYTRMNGVRLGRRYLGTAVVPKLLPKRGRFVFRHRGGTMVELEFGDSLGFMAYIFGGFERAELAALLSRLGPGDTCFDVGANVGYHTTALASAVGPSGRVCAVEPVPDNVVRLRANLALNGLGNVQVCEVAAGSENGEIELELTQDPAFVSAHGVGAGRAVGRRLRVKLVRLDDLWESQGTPRVKVMKIDTEGAELAGLAGAERMIRACRPSLLLEANDAVRLAQLDGWLLPRGYRREQPAGFETWNYLYAGD